MIKISIVLLSLITAFAHPLFAGTPGSTLRLPAIIGDHMVLQSGTPDPIWGWAAPGADVTVRFVDGKGNSLASATAKAGAGGRWSATLPALHPGIAGTLRVSAGAESRDIEDVLTGEDWLCGGQSNMEFPMARVLNAKQEIARADDPQMRLFLVAEQPAMAPLEDLTSGSWTLCTPKTVSPFSAVGYYFGKHLRTSLNEPVGLIGSYWGGTSAQVWISMDTLRQVASLNKYASGYNRVAKEYPGGADQFLKDYADYKEKVSQWNIGRVRDKDYQSALGAWRKASAEAASHQQPQPPAPNYSIPAPVGPAGGGHAVASFLYNGMIAPLAPFALRGAIWFQADGNLGHPQDYGILIKTLINDWRTQWKSDLPFYYVEMNNMRDYPQKEPVQYNNLSVLREQQQAALELPETGVACSIDVGLPQPEPHFPNKKPVGDRLALLALNNLYGQKCAANSPAYKSFQVDGNKLRIQFTDAAGLRLIAGHPFAGFAIKGATGDWKWAEGSIQGDSIVLWNDDVPQPVAARYAWAANPVISIENGAGLPLRPFRTDTQSPQ
ncbi:MAG TPA: hypothetical protein VHY22_13995 [Chthoniobacteraceae bacterium]|nr:hypothetical protein [Chthoniobacteraceae bacterium]